MTLPAIRRVSGTALPLRGDDIDTDRIIPARFLRKPRGPGYERYLFHDVRFQADGTERPEFILNQVPYRNARILVTSANFAFSTVSQVARRTWKGVFTPLTSR